MTNPICAVCELPHAVPNPSGVECINALKGKLRAILKALGKPGTCDGCAAPILWITHANGKRAPYTAAGLNHFADCPAAARFRGGTK